MVSERYQEHIHGRGFRGGGTLAKTTGDKVRHLEEMGGLRDFWMKIEGHVIHHNDCICNWNHRWVYLTLFWCDPRTLCTLRSHHVTLFTSESLGAPWAFVFYSCRFLPSATSVNHYLFDAFLTSFKTNLPNFGTSLRASVLSVDRSLFVHVFNSIKLVHHIDGGGATIMVSTEWPSIIAKVPWDHIASWKEQSSRV